MTRGFEVYIAKRWEEMVRVTVPELVMFDAPPVPEMCLGAATCLFRHLGGRHGVWLGLHVAPRH